MFAPVLSPHHVFATAKTATEEAEARELLLLATTRGKWQRCFELRKPLLFERMNLFRQRSLL
jgi:hypothetical protein